MYLQWFRLWITGELCVYKRMTTFLSIVVSSIMLVGVLIRCELFHSVCDLKDPQMNMRCSLIKELILCVWTGPYCHKITKNICCAKGEGAVDHNTVTRWFKKFHSGCKNINDQISLGKPKTMDSKALLLAIEANLTSGTWTLHLTVQCGLSPSQPWQKHPGIPNYASCYQNIAKILTHSCILILVSKWVI